MPKYMIDLGKDANRQLDEIAKEKGMTKAEVIRRAVATYVVVNRKIKNGKRLAASNSEDRVINEIGTI